MRSISFDFFWDSEEYKTRYSGKEESCTASPPEFSDRKDPRPDEFEMMPTICCQGGAEQVVTSPPSHDLLQDLTRKKPHCHAGSCHHFGQRDFRGELKFNDFLFLALCHYPLKHLYNMEVGSEEREKLQSKWHSWPPCLTEVVWKSPLSNNSIPAGSCKSPHRPRSPLISISISPCLFSNLYSQEAESPKQGKKYNSYPWTLTALLNMDLNKVFYLYAKTPYLFIFF